ncbi:hypothetical protein L2E82_32554 [Cichorium intybus]|uniref:Uncharacterized protein n=1 Tax=Cichorium intybus TaxID=13427 RepID=A0ACB9BHV2_CICIN|nr:hypothetical protein L2E82_32554 [Cichorium intybus]
MAQLTKGRKKMEMKKISDESRLLVSFSKRHSGLFKKASELCTLCGVEMAIIVFSPTKKVLSFGNPSVQTIVDRFQKQNPPANSTTFQFMQHYRNAKTKELNMQLTNLLGQLEAEKKTSEKLNQIKKARQDFLWDAPIENLGLQKLEELKVSMVELKKTSEKQVEKLMAEVANPTAKLPNSGSTWLEGVGSSIGQKTAQLALRQKTTIQKSALGLAIAIGERRNEGSEIDQRRWSGW